MIKSKLYKVKHKNDYKLLEFTKNDDILKRIKDYGHRNCKKEIKNSWIIATLNNCDMGYAYFHTEIIKTKNENNEIIETEKYRPCAYICLSEYSQHEIHIMLVCSLYTTEHLGTKLMEKVFEYAKNKGYSIISLDSTNEKNTKFYSKKGFVVTPINKKNIYDTTTYMVKKIV